MEPDGSLRKVSYTADPLHGFQAKVELIPPGASDTSNDIASPPDIHIEQTDYPHHSNTPGEEFKEENHDYSNVPYTTFENNKPFYDYNGYEGDQDSIKQEYPIPTGPEIQDINNIFKQRDLTDHSMVDNIFQKDTNFFEHSKYEERDLFEGLPPFPPLPELNVNEFSQSELGEVEEDELTK